MNDVPVGVYLGGPTEVEHRSSKIGSRAASFQMQDEDDNGVTLRRLTRRGPVILHLYRGNW